MEYPTEASEIGGLTGEWKLYITPTDEVVFHGVGNNRVFLLRDNEMVEIDKSNIKLWGRPEMVVI